MPKENHGLVIVSRVNNVYDGDTIYVDIDSWPGIIGVNIGVRIRGIDTPEIRGTTGALKAKAIWVRELLAAKVKASNRIVLRNISRGKYFRITADLEIDGEDIATLLLSKNLAKEYNGGKRPEWE